MQRLNGLFPILAALALLLSPLCALHAAPPSAPAMQNEADTLDRIQIDLEKQERLRKEAILDAKQELLEAGTSRLEIIIGAFGVVIAFVAIIFGFATREAAIAAATRGIEQVRDQMETTLARTREQQAEIDRLSEVIRAKHAEMEYQASCLFDQLIRGLIEFPVGEFKANILDIDRASISSFYSKVKDFPISVRNVSQHKIMMSYDIMRTDWPHLISHSNQVAMAFSDDDDLCSAAKLANIMALAEAGSFELAANQAEIFYRKYSNSDAVPVVRRAATALMYKSMVDYTLHNDREAESLVLRSVIQEFGGKYSDREILEIVSVAERRLAS
jgi:hypothetical protein